jgi:sugar/nucleoside kinase (ribokinase family)
MPKPQLISIGDTTLDCFLFPHEAEAVCELKTEECLLCFNYGDKVPLQNIRFSIGGNAANLAVGATKLGLRTQLYTTLGDDYSGQQLRYQLSIAGIDTTYLFTQPHTNSNYSAIISFGSERTILSYHQPRTYQWTSPQPAPPWVYLTSMGDNFQDFYHRCAHWVKTHHLKLGFNPGSRQLRAGTDSLKPILQNTHVLLVNFEEAQTLLQTKDKRLPQLLAGLRRLGPQIVVITLSTQGSCVSDGHQSLKAGILSQAPVTERTGAGDAFSTGFLSALIHNQDLATALKWGTINSASVIGHIGSQSGLLPKDQIEKTALEFNNVTNL